MKKNRLSQSILTLFAIMSTSVLAQEQSAVSTFQNFSACDAKFFKSLSENVAYWEALAPIETTNSVSHFNVANRLQPHSTPTKLSTPIEINGIKFKSYYDNFTDLGDMGVIYDWGFIVEGSADEVAEKLRPLIIDSSRFRKDGENTYVRSEVKVLDSPWVKIKTASGTAAGLSRTERVLLIESTEQKNETYVSCSIQGYVDDAILKEIRPDIKVEEYPAKISPDLFDKTEVPKDVMAAFKQTQALSAVWQPKFKSARYRFKIIDSKNKPSRDDDIVIELNILPNGLIKRKEIYSPKFNVERLMYLDMVQLKSRLNGLSDGRVNLTNKLRILSFPKSLMVGEKAEYELSSQSIPKRAGDEPFNDTTLCKVGEKIEAKTINTQLTGMATELTCNQGTVNEIKRVFLDDYGLQLMLSSMSKDGKSTYEYSHFQIEQ